MRAICADSILDLIPEKIQRAFFGWSSKREQRRSEIEDVLDLFGDGYCNRHLMYGVVELVLVRLMPELVEKGVGELWDERLS